jgi:post-segregation antitoxin (ccd killing protein)
MIRDAIENRAVKKTLTIPKWLDDLATEHGINFSRTLQEALKRQLDVPDEQLYTLVDLRASVHPGCLV